jgi:hypothetical protein
MPTIKNVAPHITSACAELKSVKGVKNVFLWGSYAAHLNEPNYVVKDVDVIAVTTFDSGDLLAIDNSKYSALKIAQSDLEDMGFDPFAVAFTKRFLSFEKYNVDHWAASADGQLLHWGMIPDSQDEWAELHTEAEKRAVEATGLMRHQLHKTSDVKRREWKKAYDQYTAKYLTSGATGWYPSEHPLDEILAQAMKV